MAVPTNTQQTYNMKGIREDLSDVIYRITPDDTPFMTMAGRKEATNTFHEWQTDDLATPRTDNAAVEGADAVIDAPSQTTRIGNWTQIMTKGISVSGTADAVNTAGRDTEMGLQAAKKAAELKLDMEATLLTNQAGQNGSGGTPRKFGSLLAFLGSGGTGNVSKGASGADPSAPNPGPTTARTDGTLRSLSETNHLKPVLAALWQNGGKATTLMTGGVLKMAFSTNVTGIAQKTNEVGNTAATVVAAVDVYVGDFGNLKIVPNRLMRPRDILLLDFSLIQLAYLRKFFVENLGKTGDNTKKQMVVEFTLRVGNEKGLGLITDLQP